MTEFAFCFEAHRTDGLVCAIKWPLGQIDDDQDWQLVKSVHFEGPPMQTVYRGAGAVQPKFYLTGTGDTLTITNGCAVIDFRW